MAEPIKTRLFLIGEQGTAIWTDSTLVASMTDARQHPRQARATAAKMVMSYNMHDVLFEYFRARKELDKALENDELSLEEYETKHQIVIAAQMAVEAEMLRG